MAMYFSRAPIPFVRDFIRNSAGEGDVDSTILAETRIHIGIYAYRVAFLTEYANLPASKLEAVEQLEQLRVLDAGYKLHVGEVSEAVAQAKSNVNT